MSGFDALFDEFAHTAFRLEQRRSYNVGGQEAVRLAAYREHTARPERSVRTDPWLARISATTLAGKQWRRVRVVDDPLTDYERYQFASGSYLESQTAGDEVLVVDRTVAEPWLHGVPGDFWLFDRGHRTQRAVALDYTAEGAFAGFRELDGDELADALTAQDELTQRAVSLAEFLAREVRSVA